MKVKMKMKMMTNWVVEERVDVDVSRFHRGNALADALGTSPLFARDAIARRADHPTNLG